jgi:hypothetical protein
VREGLVNQTSDAPKTPRSLNFKEGEVVAISPL